MYVIVRKDMSPGDQACQAVHAAFDYSMAHPESARSWHTESNHVCLLEVENEAVLLNLLEEFKSTGHRSVVVVEPDMDNEATAVAVEPDAKRLLRKLRLAFKT